MTDQPKPKQPPDQPKAPEPKAQEQPDSAKPKVDTDSKETAPKIPESAASPKPVQPAPEPPGTKPAEAGVKAASPDTDKAQAASPSVAATARTTGTPQSDVTEPAKPATAPLTSEKAPAEAAPAQTAPSSPDKPGVAGSALADASAPTIQEPDKPAAESVSAPKAPSVPDKPTVAGAASTGATAAPMTTPASPSSVAGAASPSASVPASEEPSVPTAKSPEQSATSTAPLAPPPGSPPAQPAAPAPSTASMQQRCPNCGHRNRPGVLVCENCGTNLLTGKASVAGTRDLLREQEAQETGSATASAKPGTAPLVDSTEMKAVQSAGSAVFEDNMVLRIEIEGGATPILVYPKQEIIFGRRDPTSGGMPDVDLTPYAGYRMGVSRRHAAIRLQDKRLDVSDLGSSNGTFLNGTRLSAHRPYQVRDGDEIRLGQMVMKVFFQTNTGRK